VSGNTGGVQGLGEWLNQPQGWIPGWAPKIRVRLGRLQNLAIDWDD